MAERIYLHIGAAKTGTSYLQLLIWNNREQLREQGIHLPLEGRRNHFDAVADLRGGAWADKKITRTWDELVASTREIEGTALVSEELLCASPPEKIQRIVESLAPAEVHVILTARDLGRQAPANWQQLVRARGTTTYADYLRGMSTSTTHPFWQVQDPAAVHRQWGPYLQDGRFHLVTVPQRGSSAPVLWERFASVIGADPSTAEAPTSNQNESLGLVETELLRRFNAQLGDAFPWRAPYIERVRRLLTVPALMGADNERIGLPHESSDWVRARSERMVDEVRALGGEIDVVGDPDDLLADITVALRGPDEIADKELLDRALHGWVRQLEFLVEEEQQRGVARRRRRARWEAAAAAERANTVPRRAWRKARSVAARVRGRVRG